jgi:hypothetical protein
LDRFLEEEKVANVAALVGTLKLGAS